MRLSLRAASCLVLAGSTAWADRITTNGFQSCDKSGSSTVTVQKLDLAFDRATNLITFDVAGVSTIQQEVTASLLITAYGVPVYNNSFDPCASNSRVAQLCPVPAGQFSASGSQQVPTAYADKIPAIAYTVPDLDGNAQMILTGKNGQQVACIQSTVTNGKSVEVPAVSYVAAAMAAAALALSLMSAAMAGGQPGTSHSSPGFTEVILWFQSIAMDGMMTIKYPGIYRSFTRNFAFSTGLLPWGTVQTSIDKFRAMTGGNTTENGYEYLRNVTLVYGDGSATGSTKSISKRTVSELISRQAGLTTSINGTSTSSPTASFKQSKLVVGLQAYAEQLAVPSANVFMNVLLAFALVTAVIVVAILLLKVILEAWSLIGRYPKSLMTFRKEYWRILAQTITSLIFLLYGVWVLYCIYQFTHGDSWVAKVLAGVTLGVFTATLAFYTWQIWSHVRKVKRTHGTTEDLFDNKETWKKYSLFYASYKASYWWLFMPTIVYMFAKGCVLAGGDGHGLVQSVGQLAIETIMLILLLWSRPYNRKSSNWINIVIQIVRVVSIGLIIVFVSELGIKQSTKTITGVVLIGVQAGLTGILALLIVINAAIQCCKENPHRKRRKAAEQARGSRNLEGDAFLMEARQGHKDGVSLSILEYDDVRAQAVQKQRGSRMGLQRGESEDTLTSNAAGIAGTGKGGYQALSQGMVSYESSAPGLPAYSYNGYSNELQHHPRGSDSDYVYGGQRPRVY